MPRENSRGSNSRNESWSSGVMDMARERPVAAAAVAAGAAAAGLFLWSRRSQITQQLSDLSDQIGEWTGNMGSGTGGAPQMDDTAGLTTTSQRGRGTGRSGAGSRSAMGTRGRTSTGSRNRGMSETGGGNASLGAHSGGIGTTTTGSPSGRGRAADTENS
jgi:hypothetical protein